MAIATYLRSTRLEPASGPNGTLEALCSSGSSEGSLPVRHALHTLTHLFGEEWRRRPSSQTALLGSIEGASRSGTLHARKTIAIANVVRPSDRKHVGRVPPSERTSHAS